MVYMGGAYDSYVVAFDPATGEKIARIPVPGTAAVLLYNPVTDQLIAGGGILDSISIIDCPTSRVVATISARADLNRPFPLCVDSAGVVYAAVPRLGTVLVIQGDTVSARIPVGELPAAICYGAATGRVYCANHGDSTLSVIRGDSVVETVVVGTHPGPMALASELDRLYISTDDSGIAALDILSDSIIARVPVSMGALTLGYNPVNRKVYYTPIASGLVCDSVTIISADSNRAIARVPTGVWAMTWTYSPAANRVYIMCERSGFITVVDGASDSVLTNLQVGLGDGKPGICFDATDNYVIAATESNTEVSVVDCENDSILFAVQAGANLLTMAVSTGGAKLYFVDSYNDLLHIAEPGTGTVVRTLSSGVRPRLLLAPPAHDKLYVGNVGRTVTVIDTRQDSILATDTVPSAPAVMCYDALDDVVYCLCRGYNGAGAAISGSTDSVTALITMPRGPTAACWNSTDSKLYADYFLNNSHHGFAVLDCARETLRTALETHDPPNAFVHNPVNDRVYCAVHPDNSVLVVDGATDIITDRIPTGRGPQAMVLNTRNNCLYLAEYHDDAVAVVDCTTDSIVDRVAVGDEPSVLSYNPRNNKVYCINHRSNDVTVINCRDNTVAATIPVGSSPRTIAYDPVHNRTFVGNYLTPSVSVLADSMSGLEETPNAEVRSANAIPTIVRGVLELAVDSRQRTAYKAELLDASGRRVAELHPGPNDVSRLGAGVYFVRDLGSGDRGRGEVRRVVIAR
jgi:YVTN family beta-propeller protein